MRLDPLTPDEENEERESIKLEFSIEKEIYRIVEDDEYGQAVSDFIASILNGDQDQESIELFHDMVENSINCSFKDRHLPFNRLVHSALYRQAINNIHDA
jgi:hypothetical protein